MPAKKAQKRAIHTPKNFEKKEQSSTSSLFNFGESYSSLLLGIVVVIITTVLLIFLVKDRNTVPSSSIQKSVSSTSTKRSDDQSQIAVGSVTPTTVVTSTIVPTTKPTVVPTIKPTVKPTNRPTNVPTITKVPTITRIPTKVKPTATVVPTKAVAQKPTTTITMKGNEKVHVVAAGENLWTIAEKYYQSGYNWVDIARANNLSNPGVITSGMKLVIPNVTPKVATIQKQQSNVTEFGPKITASTYTVQQGDHLWGIAVRAYDNGYKWVDIARVNNITNPSIIHVGLVLKLPRTAATK